MGVVTDEAVVDGGLVGEGLVGDLELHLVVAGEAVLGDFAATKQVRVVRLMRLVTGGAGAGGKRAMVMDAGVELVATEAKRLDGVGGEQELGL